MDRNHGEIVHRAGMVDVIYRGSKLDPDDIPKLSPLFEAVDRIKMWVWQRYCDETRSNCLSPDEGRSMEHASNGRVPRTTTGNGQIERYE